METLKKLLWISAILMLVSSCSKEEMVEKTMEIPEGKILVNTEVVVDGVVQTNTRASSEAGYTTGDGLYDAGDQVTVAATANDGYELVRFYDKSGDAKYQDNSSYTFPARIPQTFKAEFAKKYTITVSASPTAGGTVSGGGKYRSGKTCTLTATANAGYVFDGWYEGSTKLSSNTSYSFTVSSNRTITGKFGLLKLITVGNNGYIISPSGVQQVGTNEWNAIAYGNGRYVVVGNNGYITSSTDGVNWDTPIKINAGSGNEWLTIAYGNGTFVIGNWNGRISSSTDGKNWTTPTILRSDISLIQDIIFANGKFIVLGLWTSSGYVATSEDGILWSSPVVLDTSTYWSSLAYGNNRIIAGGKWDSSVSTGRIIISDNGGASWQSAIKVGTNDWTSITYGNGKFVALGDKSIVTSTDGEHWSKQTTILFNGSVGKKVNFINGAFVILASGSYGSSILISEDADKWLTTEEIMDNNGNEVKNLNSFCAMP